MRRIGSNIRKQNNDAKAHRIIRNIIKYTDDTQSKLFGSTSGFTVTGIGGSDSDNLLERNEVYKIELINLDTTGPGDDRRLLSESRRCRDRVGSLFDTGAFRSVRCGVACHDRWRTGGDLPGGLPLSGSDRA